MELSELTAYAEEKYHIHEEHKWPEFPRLSVLADPDSGKWLALLMRQWDFDAGTEIQRCDLKCGQSSLSQEQEPYLTWPYRMKGEKWIGIMFDERTEEDVIFRLFDRAVRLNKGQGATIVLETGASAETVICPDPGHSGTGADFNMIFPEIPEKISQMRRLYRFEDHSFQKKCMNFYLQGKFMEDYEDDAPWSGVFRRFFPTYHDQNLPQLRGYFTWRSHVRKGEYLPIAESLAYIYVYELLNGIGTDSPEDALDKMSAFETGFLDSGIGDADMRANLHRWMMEYAIIHDVSPDAVRQYLSDDLLQRDDALSVLQNPKEAEDKEVFEALCMIIPPEKHRVSKASAPAETDINTTIPVLSTTL